MRARKRPRKLNRPTETVIEIHEEYASWLFRQAAGSLELSTMHRRVMFWDEQFLKRARGKINGREKLTWIATRAFTTIYDVEWLLNEAEHILLLRDLRGLDISPRYRAYTPSWVEMKTIAQIEQALQQIA